MGKIWHGRGSMYKKILAIVKRYTVVQQFLGPHSELDFSGKNLDTAKFPFLWKNNDDLVLTFTILRETGELEFSSVCGRHHKQGSTLSFITILRLEEIDTQQCPLSRLYLCFFLIKSNTEKEKHWFCCLWHTKYVQTAIKRKDMELMTE